MILLRRILREWMERRRAAKARILLRALSDHTLRDIGLRREQIEDYNFFKR